MAGLNCEYFHKPRLNIFITLGSIAKLATPIVLSIMRYNDPTIKKRVGKVFKQIFQKDLVNYGSVSSNEENWLN